MSALISSTPVSKVIRKYTTPRTSQPPSQSPSQKPSQPTSQLAQNTPLPPSPGTWRHPKFDEISRRQHLTTFNDNNLYRVLTNSLFLILTFIASSLLTTYLPLLPPSTKPYTTYALLTLHLLPLYNILVALSPLYLPTPTFTDIPLTPTQRSLLNLPLASTTPESTYVTPPRYPRSASGSPLSGSQNKRKESPGNYGRSRTGDSAFAPSTPSPLWQKAVEGRRGSSGSGSPLGKCSGGTGSVLGGNVLGASVLGKPSTPSPSQVGRGNSVALNSKWLYERGRASFGDRGTYL